MKEQYTANLELFSQKAIFPEEKICARTLLRICGLPHIGDMRDMLSPWLEGTEPFTQQDALYLQQVLLKRCLFAEVTFKEGVVVSYNGFFGEPSMIIRELDGEEKKFFGEEREAAFMNWLEAKDMVS